LSPRHDGNGDHLEALAKIMRRCALETDLE